MFKKRNIYDDFKTLIWFSCVENKIFLTHWTHSKNIYTAVALENKIHVFCHHVVSLTYGTSVLLENMPLKTKLYQTILWTQGVHFNT